MSVQSTNLHNKKWHHFRIVNYSSLTQMNGVKHTHTHKLCGKCVIWIRISVGICTTYMNDYACVIYRSKVQIRCFVEDKLTEEHLINFPCFYRMNE